MSADLWESQNDEKANAFVTMNAHGTLFLTVGEDIYQTYTFPATSEGFKEAEGLRTALDTWLALKRK